MKYFLKKLAIHLKGYLYLVKLLEEGEELRLLFLIEIDLEEEE